MSPHLENQLKVKKGTPLGNKLLHTKSNKSALHCNKLVNKFVLLYQKKRNILNIFLHMHNVIFYLKFTLKEWK